ncbi:hypothetical protein ELD29_10910, partial [Klebsiella pneumoniae]|nr:hypothetical protein [Klebsiella pneumoniae]MBL1588700.1 hypothetical protein [Klebsiella pneumoniae]MBL2100851.1 hypothetical protein [Klebsiella pneumoniae]
SDMLHQHQVTPLLTLRYLQYLCELTHALRRCDRGTDAMHLANTPVVSPESKKPKALTSGLNSLCVDNRSYGDDIRFT